MPRIRVWIPTLVACLAVVGCASSGPRARGADPSSAAEVRSAPHRHDRRAGREAGASADEAPRPRADVPPPQGIEAGLLAPRDLLDPAALLPLAMAIRECAERPLPLPPAAAEALPPIEAGRRDEAIRHYLRGREEAMRGRYLASATHLETARELDPTSAAILRSLARCYEGLGNSVRAGGVYAQLLGLAPDDPEALFVLGVTAASRREFESAARMHARLLLPGAPAASDPAVEMLARYTMHFALARLGYDRASIEAGAEAAAIAFPGREMTRYGQLLATLYRRRSEVWRDIGDAYCRLGSEAEALEAYGRALALPVADPASVRARIIYANLRLGRTAAAQRELLTLLAAAGEGAGDREVRLCEYVAARIPDHALVADAVLELHRKAPEAEGLARSAAVLLSPGAAQALLEAFVARRPRDLGAVGQLLTWIGARDPEAAVVLTSSLVGAMPDLADDYVRRLMMSLSDPVGTLHLGSDPASGVMRGPLATQVRARAFAERLAPGSAWACCRAGLARWPDDEGLLLLQVRLAGRLDEPGLMALACDEAEHLTSIGAGLVRAAAWREMEEYDRALEAVAEAEAAADGNPPAGVFVERAAILAGQATDMEIDGRREAVCREVVQVARQALAVDPRNEIAFGLIVAMYRQNGPLSDSGEYRAIIDELRRSARTSGLYMRLAIEDMIRRGRFEAALDGVQRRMESDPSDREALGLAIVAWEGLGRRNDGEAWLRTRLREHPGDPVALDQLARLLVSTDRADAAAELLSARPDAEADPAVRRLRQTIYQMQGENDLARALGERRLMIRPEGSRRELQLALLYAQTARPQEAVARLEWIAEHADEASRRHLIGAIGLANRLRDGGPAGDEVTARLVERTVERFPERSIPIYTTGLVALRRIEEGWSRFDALLERAAMEARGADDGSLQRVLPWRDLAQRLVDDGHPDAAARALRARLDRDLPFEPEAVALLASMILSAEAVTDAEARSSLAMLLELQARGIVPALPGVDGPPTIAGALSAAGSVYTLVGNEAGSEFLLRESIRLDPSDAMAMNNLGYMMIEAGRDDADCVGWIEQAHEMAPDEPNILDTVAWLRYKQGRFDDGDDGRGARSLLREVLDISGEPSPEVLDHYGDTLWRLGKPKAAQDAWREALTLLEDPEQESETVRNYGLIQSRVWGLLVVEPEVIYHRDYGVLRERLRRKLDEVTAGAEPEIAATFAEFRATPQDGRNEDVGRATAVPPAGD